MGLIKAALGAVGGTFADQWKDFLTVPQDIEPTAALFPAIPLGANANRGSNRKGSNALVSNGSRIVVPEGYGLLLMQDGELTAFASEPGGYVWESDDLNSQSIFAGDSVITSVVNQSWQRFKFGGQPGSQQIALFVSLKELPNNNFGTQSEVYWDDEYLNSQVGVLAHGTYSIQIVDPILFVKHFVPARYLQAQDVFDFTDRMNDSASQLFSEIVGSLAAAFSRYSNDSTRGNRITGIQQDSIVFAASLAQVVEESYHWESSRGIRISKVSILGIRYDENTKEVLKSVQRADALAGNRGNSNLQASVASGIQSAGETGGTEGVLGMGLAGGAINLSAFMNQAEKSEISPQDKAGSTELLVILENLKRAYESGLIDQSEFAAAKAKALGI